jgi:uncharacterized protein YeaO (DUF488 family)
MTTILLKRVYDDWEEKDGYRIFVDRLWPRGMKKENLHYDLWAKNITPSPELRGWFHQNPDNNWDKFVELYNKELDNNNSLKEVVNEIKKHDTVTLLYASKDGKHNHAIILKDHLEKEMK